MNRTFLFVACAILLFARTAVAQLAPLPASASDISTATATAAGTATSRLVAVRLSDRLDLLDFGADPTGASPSDAAFAAADAAGVAAGGKTILLPYGTYLLNNYHSLSSNFNLWVRGPNVSFTGAGSASPFTDNYVSGTGIYRQVAGTGGQNTVSVGMSIHPSTGNVTYQQTAVHAHVVNTDNNPSGAHGGVAYQAIAEIAGQSATGHSEVWGMDIRAITQAGMSGSAIGLEIGSENYGNVVSDYASSDRKAAMQVYASGSADSLFAYMAASASPGVRKFYDGFVVQDNSVSRYAIRLINSTGSGPTNWFDVDPTGHVTAASLSTTGPISGPVSSATVTATGGSVARALADRAADRYNVLDFGVKGDGTTDDAPAINTLRSLASSNGGAIWFPGGRIYKLGSTVYSVSNVGYLFDSGVTLSGGGMVGLPDESAVNGKQAMAIAKASSSSASGSAHALVVEHDNAAGSTTASYERSGIYVNVRQSDGSIYGSYDHDLVGMQITGTMNNAAGRLFGSDINLTIPSGMDGYVVGQEIGLNNYNAAAGDYGTPTAKIGDHLVAGGTANLTAAVAVVQGAGSSARWQHGLYVQQIAIAGDAFALRNSSNTANLAVIDTGGNISGTSVASTGGTLSLSPLTVSTLPTCNSGSAGTLATVSDANAPTWRGALTGGGSATVLALCDGTAWLAH